MDNLERLNTLCPVCDGPVSFEADRLGEQVHCPHCEEMIALGSVVPLPAEQGAPFETTDVDQSARNGIKLLAAVAAIIVLLFGGVLLFRKAKTVQPPAKLNPIEMAAEANHTPPVQPEVTMPTPPPAVTPPLPDQDVVLIELARQRQEEVYQEQVIAEMRRANDLAEANARWQQWNEMQSRSIADSQPSEPIPPAEVVEPVQVFQPIELIQPPIGGVYFRGGMRTGSPAGHYLSGPVSQRGQGITAIFVNRVKSTPYAN
jgi:hypothetical protein